VRCERKVIDIDKETARILESRRIIREDTKAFAADDKVWDHLLYGPKDIFFEQRKFQDRSGMNRLEIQNNNSKPLAVAILDENSSATTLLGTVEAGTIQRFILERDTLYDSYSIQGLLGLGRCAATENLSFRKFYNKVVFQRNTVGTTAVLEKTADIY